MAVDPSVESTRDPQAVERQSRELVAVAGGNYRKAVEAHANLVADRDGARHSEQAEITVAELLERWKRDYIASHVRPLTSQGYESIIRLRLVPAFGTLRLSDDDEPARIGVYRRMIEKGELQRGLAITRSTALRFERLELVESVGIGADAGAWKVASHGSRAKRTRLPVRLLRKSP